MLPALLAGLWLGVPSPAPAQTTAQASLLAQALDAAATGDWTEAATLAAWTGNPVAKDILLWTRLRDGAGTWDEYEAFLAAHPDWPGLATLRRAGERQMPKGLPPEAVVAFFAAPPETGTGSLRLAEALKAGGHEADAEAEIVRAWTRFSLTGAERSAMLEGWPEVVKPHHEERIDMLLWRGLTSEAEAMLRLVDEDWQKLAQARIATRRDAEGMQYLINTVPARLKNDPGLAYERYRYRVAKARWQDAEAYILEKSTSATALGRPEMWMERRANLARQALEDGDVVGAYRIAAQNFGSEGADYADSEWVAGFIALTRLDDPKRAIGHFTRFQAVVGTPISLGRAGYWLGKAFAASGDAKAAESAFRMGAKYQTSFYGQLAAAELGLPPDAGLVGVGERPDWRNAPIMQSGVVKAAYFLHLADDDRRASQFFRHAAEGQPPETRAALAQMAIDLGRPQIGIRISKDAAAEGMILADQYYPLHAVAEVDWPVPTEFMMAIARQESELDARAASSAGARGLMQLMPATAKHMADEAGVAYSAVRLGTDPRYNARLGTTYLAQMLDRYDGAYVLATAAYNAGPGRVDQWLKANGDPRKGGVDSVEWIEAIPYTETRNYVMRVMESLHVYRARLKGEAAPVQIVSDINGGTG
ncbi:MAG TPA: lytic transglycosylase domain-containing protein [Amaricoccus sp.]|nr:lytic transglycosylase domain-containing protein [Amaricoccus sp.]